MNEAVPPGLPAGASDSFSVVEFRREALAFIDWIGGYLSQIERYPVRAMVEPGQFDPLDHGRSRISSARRSRHALDHESRLHRTGIPYARLAG